MIPVYQQQGFTLVPLRHNSKQPSLPRRWAERSNCIPWASPADPNGSYGLAHAYSNTVAIDVDNYEATRQWFTENGLDLSRYFDLGVQIVSGVANHGKLIYRLPTNEPALPSWTVTHNRKHCFQFRCGTRRGTTMQDVLPPAIHPDTGKPYQWKGDFEHLPTIPQELFTLWKTAVTADETKQLLGDVQASQAELESALAVLDPDMHRDDWVRVGMALQSTDPDLYWLFDEWSSNGTKYSGSHDTEAVWRSFHSDTDNGVTARSLFRLARDAGWRGYKRPLDEIFTPLPVTSYGPDIIDVEYQHPAEPVEPPGLFAWAKDHLDAVNMTPNWVIKGIMESGQVGLLYGSSQALKSYLALDIAFHLALGRDWQGHSIPEAGDVWFLAGEGNTILWRRLEALRQFHGVRTEELGRLGLSYKGLNLMDGADLQKLQEFAAARGRTPRLLIIDTLSRNAMIDENSAKEAADVIDRCVNLAHAWNCSVLLVHHTGKKDKGTARGSSVFEANTDFRYLVERDETQLQYIGTSMTIQKLKGAPEPVHPIDFEAKLTTLIGKFDADGVPLTDLVLTRLKKQHEHVSTAEQRKLRGRQSLVLNMGRELLADRAGIGKTQTGFMSDELWAIYSVADHEVKPHRGNLNKALESLVGKGFFSVKEVDGAVWYLDGKKGAEE